MSKRNWNPNRYWLALVGLFLNLALFAQPATRPLPPYVLGLSLGSSYQTSDVRTDNGGFGASIWLGREYAPAAPVGFGLRGRLSYSKSLGLDPFPTTAIGQNEALNGTRELNYVDYPDELNVDQGFVYFNHRTDLVELGAEAVFTLNRLREQTGFHVALYGGYGLDWYNVRYDQAGPDGQPYHADYAGLDANAPKDRIRNTLRNQILDGVYETAADGFDDGLGQLKFMPSAGIELGFDLTPNFALVGGHRMTFSGTDLLDGQQWEDAGNDILHYTSLGLQWRIQPRYREKRPTIEVVAPALSPWTSPVPEAEVRARIRHVPSPAGVSCTLNGYPAPFEFFGEQFTCRAPLQPGRNEVIITATNSRGTAREVVVILWTPPAGPPPPLTAGYRPEIRFLAPPYDGFETRQAAFTLEAELRHVHRRRDVQLWLNDYRIDDFRFSDERLSANVTLREGRNVFRIRAANEAGTTEETISLRYLPEWQLPEVRITRPATDEYHTTESRVRLEAAVKHVSEKEDIRLTVNGRNWPRFSFDGRTLRADISVPAGSTRVRIAAHNEAGQASDEVTIVRQDLPAEPARPPRVTFVQPDKPTLTHSQPEYTIVAQVDNVRDKEQITFTVNGQRVWSYDWDGYTLRKRIVLERGDNVVRIAATNADGTDEAQARIRYVSDVQLEQKPRVRITAPADGSTVVRPDIALEARVEHVASRQDIEVWQSGQRIHDFRYDAGNGRLTATLQLREGSQMLRVIARNAAGTADDAVTVRYEPKEPPSVRITFPETDHYRTGKDRLTAKATVQHVTALSELDIRLNNQPLRGVRFDAKTGVLIAPLRLREGDNLLRIVARTRDGEASDDVTITYTPPKPPTVRIVQPADGTTVSEATITLKARTTHVPTQKSVALMLNGKPVKGFGWNARGEVQATLHLREGDNTIEISVQNRDGRASDRVHVRYERPVPPPVVTFVLPARNGLRTDKATADIRATIKHVDGPDDVRLTVNGRQVKNFKWDSRTHALMATIRLREGQNEVSVTATTATGTDTDSRTIIYAPAAPEPEPAVAKPTIAIESISQPVTNPMNPDAGRSTLIATITGVRDKKQIQLLVNGKPAAFTFQPKGGRLQATFSLQRGDNTVVLRATNEGGTTTETRKITF